MFNKTLRWIFEFVAKKIITRAEILTRRMNEKQRSQATLKQKHPKSVCASFGPPDKCQHFDGNSSKRRKTDENVGERREVELHAGG